MSINKNGGLPHYGYTNPRLLPLNRRSTVLHLPAILEHTSRSNYRKMNMFLNPKVMEVWFKLWLSLKKVKDFLGKPCEHLIKICRGVRKIDFCLIVDRFHQSWQLRQKTKTKCSTFTNLYSMWMKFEGFASTSPPLHSKLIKWIWQHHQYINQWIWQHHKASLKFKTVATGHNFRFFRDHGGISDLGIPAMNCRIAQFASLSFGHFMGYKNGFTINSFTIFTLRIV